MDIVRTSCKDGVLLQQIILRSFDVHLKRKNPYSLTGFTISKPAVSESPSTRTVLLGAGQGRRPNDAKEAQRQGLKKVGSCKQTPEI